MTQLNNIHRIIEEVSELKDLLKVISECNGNIPSILYKLAQEKAQVIAENISSLTEKRPEPIVESVFQEIVAEPEPQPEEAEQEMPEVVAEEQTVQPIPEPVEPEIEENETQQVSVEVQPEPVEPVITENTVSPAKQTEEVVSSVEQTSSNATVVDNTIGGQNGARLLDDILKQRIASKDIRKAISLNDRFRFKRDLFGGSDEAMNKTIEILNQMHSAEDALNYIEKNFRWNYEDETTNDFITILEKRFSL